MKTPDPNSSQEHFSDIYSENSEDEKETKYQHLILFSAEELGGWNKDEVFEVQEYLKFSYWSKGTKEADLPSSELRADRKQKDSRQKDSRLRLQSPEKSHSGDEPSQNLPRGESFFEESQSQSQLQDSFKTPKPWFNNISTATRKNSSTLPVIREEELDAGRQNNYRLDREFYAKFYAKLSGLSPQNLNSYNLSETLLSLQQNPPQTINDSRNELVSQALMLCIKEAAIEAELTTTNETDVELDERKVAKFLRYAKEQGGIGRTENADTSWVKDFAVTLSDEESREAIRFSKIFQTKTKELGIYTGRKSLNRTGEWYKNFGLRLTFVPIEVYHQFAEVRNTDTCISTEKKRDRRTLPSRKTQPAVMARIRGFNKLGTRKNLTRMFEGVAEQVTQTTKASPLKTATTTKVIQN